MQLLKPVDQTSLDPNYLKVYRAYENVMFTDMGNNATFDGAGSIIGQASLSITPSEILTKNKVYKYSANGLNGQNDYVGFTVPLFSAFKNNTRSFQFKIKTVNANDGDISSNVKIVGGTRDGYIYKKLLSSAGNGATYSQAFDVPADTTSLVIGFQNHSTSTTIQFFVDDISLGYKAFDYVNNVYKESWLIESAQNAMTALGDYQFPVSPTVLKNGNTSSQTEFSLNSNLIYHDRSTAGQSRFYATKDCRVSIRLGSRDMGPNSGVYIGHAGRLYCGATSTSLTGYFGEANAVIYMKAGEYFWTGTATGTTTNNTAVLDLNIEATLLTDNIIQQSVTTDRIGETIYLLKNVAPSGFIPAMGSSIGKTTGTFQGDTYKALYDLLWTVSTVTAGDPYLISSAKGASSQVDWDLNKTITIDESGLFTRAFKTGVSGVVGAKQSDAFQGHWHAYYGKNDLGGGEGSNSSGSPNWGPHYNTVRDPSSDGVNGTPRTASETRPVNVAKYVFIRYANLVPNIYALPVAAQQDYTIECRGNSGQAVNTGTNIPWTLFSQNNLTWSGSSFTAPIAGTYHISGNIYSNSSQHQLAFYIDGVLSKSVSLQNSASVQDFFSQDIYLLANQTFSIRDLSYAWTLNASLSAYHTLKITRLNGKNDSVCVGEVSKNLEAVIEYRGNGTRTTLTTTPVAMPLSIINGDSQIVSIASNQFTLQAGEYEIDWGFMHYASSGTSSTLHYLYNITDASEIKRGFASYTNNLSSYLNIKGTPTKISLTSAKVFELRVLSNGGVNFIGDTLAAPNDMNGFIKVTKLLGL